MRDNFDADKPSSKIIFPRFIWERLILPSLLERTQHILPPFTWKPFPSLFSAHQLIGFVSTAITTQPAKHLKLRQQKAWSLDDGKLNLQSFWFDLFYFVIRQRNGEKGLRIYQFAIQHRIVNIRFHKCTMITFSAQKPDHFFPAPVRRLRYRWRQLGRNNHPHWNANLFFVFESIYQTQISYRLHLLSPPLVSILSRRDSLLNDFAWMDRCCSEHPINAWISGEDAIFSALMIIIMTTISMFGRQLEMDSEGADEKINVYLLFHGVVVGGVDTQTLGFLRIRRNRSCNRRWRKKLMMWAIPRPVCNCFIWRRFIYCYYCGI